MKVIEKQLYFRGVPTNYTISTTGVLKNADTGKTLSGWIGQNGYRVASIAVNYPFTRNFYKMTIHRMVAETFIQNPKNLYCVNHKDGNKLNNDVSNLEWCTIAENNAHAKKMGLIKTGEQLSYATVDDQTVHKICQLITEGKRNIEIIDELGLPHDQHGKSLITRIRIGRDWKDISSQYDFIKKGSLKKVSDEVIRTVCEYLCDGYKLCDIKKDLGIMEELDYKKLKALVYDIRTGRCHRQILRECIDKSSTIIPADIVAAAAMSTGVGPEANAGG